MAQIWMQILFKVAQFWMPFNNFLKSEVPQVVFCTYQSSALIEQAHLDLKIPSFDLAVADEAHRCTGRVGTDFTTVLNNSKIRSSKRLFTTATPRTYSSVIKKGAEDLGVEVVGMDDEEVFGPVLHTLSFHEAINRKLLTDYRVIIIGVDDPMLASLIKTRTLVERKDGGTSDAEAIASQVGLLKAIKDYDLARMISFHGRVSRAESFAKEVQNLLPLLETSNKPSGSLWADVVSGDMPTNRRKVKLDQLRSSNLNERGLLTNARCLSEGIDVPSLDGVAFIDPRSSQVDIIQAVGRAIRKSEDKIFGTIVLPVFIRNEDDPSEAIESSNFKPVWDVINALKAHDQDLALELEQLRTEMGKRSETGVRVQGLQKIHFDLPIQFDDKFTNQLKTRLVEQTTATWDYWFGLLQSYVFTHGSALVSASYIDSQSGLKLGNWVTTQRATKANKNFARQAKLESLHGWTWSPLDDKWEMGFSKLVKFVELNGHSRVPDNFELDGYQLGSWVGKTRRGWLKLSEDQMRRLTALPNWTIDARESKWLDMFNLLLEFQHETGTAKVPDKFIYKNQPLGNWVSMQRDSKKKGVIKVERVKLLEQLADWSWDPQNDDWLIGFKHLENFVEEFNHCKVPSKPKYVSPDGFKLGSWLQKQKNNRQNLSKDRVEKLESIDGWTWNARLEKWNAGFQKLCEFVLKEGHCDIPKGYCCDDGLDLHLWANQQRWQWLDLSKELQNKLLSINGWGKSIADLQLKNK